MELLYRIGTYSTRRDTTSRNVNNILKSTYTLLCGVPAIMSWQRSSGGSLEGIRIFLVKAGISRQKFHFVS